MRQSVPVDRIFPGVGGRMRQNHRGSIFTARDTAGEWPHPWSLSFEFAVLADGTQEWRAYVEPGFVNGRDAHITMRGWEAAPAASAGTNLLTGEELFAASVFRPPQKVRSSEAQDVPLTNEVPPYLVLTNWRNPLASAGVVATEDGSIRTRPGEGYPAFFNSLGVKLPARAGNPLVDVDALVGQTSAGRDREIRAMDLVLLQPRIGSALDVELTPSGLVTGQPLVSYSTRTVSSYVVLTEGRTKLEAFTKFVPPGEDDIEATFGLLLSGGDEQTDRLKLATVWIISPPGATQDDQPDGTWEPYAQYDVCWNLAWAAGAFADVPQDTPIVFGGVPLAFGLANPLLNSFLAVFNTMSVEALAFLAKAKAGGAFWTQ